MENALSTQLGFMLIREAPRAWPGRLESVAALEGGETNCHNVCCSGAWLFVTLFLLLPPTFSFPLLFFFLIFLREEESPETKRKTTFAPFHFAASFPPPPFPPRVGGSFPVAAPMGSEHLSDAAQAFYSEVCACAARLPPRCTWVPPTPTPTPTPRG